MTITKRSRNKQLVDDTRWKQKGGSHKIHRSKPTVCAKCGGSGRIAAVIVCPTCHGLGEVEE